MVGDLDKLGPRLRAWDGVPGDDPVAVVLDRFGGCDVSERELEVADALYGPLADVDGVDSVDDPVEVGSLAGEEAGPLSEWVLGL